MKPKQPPIAGTGALRFAGASEPIDYALQMDAKTGAGVIKGAPEVMRAAFRAGDARLTLSGGEQLWLQVIAHSEGADTAYVRFDEKRLLPAPSQAA